MNKINNFYQNKTIFIGLDLHKKTWNLTARCEGIQIKYWAMPASKEKLVTSLSNLYPGASFVLAYEAGCFGYRVYDYLMDHGIKTIITPVGLIYSICQATSRTPQFSNYHACRMAIYLQTHCEVWLDMPIYTFVIQTLYIRTQQAISVRTP